MGLFRSPSGSGEGARGWNLALGQQAWGHTLTRLWAALPQQDWQPPPPEGLEDRLRLLDGFSIPTRYPDSYPEGTPGLRGRRAPQAAEGRAAHRWGEAAADPEAARAAAGADPFPAAPAAPQGLPSLATRIVSPAWAASISRENWVLAS